MTPVMSVIVTGASGFLGGFVMRAFAAAGVPATGVARSARPASSMVRVTEYADAPTGNVLVHLAETRDRNAAQSAGHNYVEHVVATLERLIAKGYGRIIYVSSALVYGDESAVPRRSGDPVFARDLYTRAKLDCEARVLEVGGVVARLSNLYGPGMAANNVVSEILDQIPGEGPVRVQDDTPVRDFIWVGNAALALVTMARSDCRGIYNVGTGTGVSIGELAHLALQLAGQPGRAVAAWRPSGAFSCNVLDIAETVERLGWRPRTTLHEGMQTLLQNRRPAEMGT